MDCFSRRLRNARRCLGKTQAEMAAIVGLSRTGYAALEEAGRGRVMEKLPKLAKALGCRIDDLFPEMDERNEDKPVRPSASPGPVSATGGGPIDADGFEDDDSLDGWAM